MKKHLQHLLAGGKNIPSTKYMYQIKDRMIGGFLYRLPDAASSLNGFLV